MGIESSAQVARPSNFHGDKFATKKIQSPRDRISFRDIAKLASRRKTEKFLSDRTGCDDRTAKRWLSGESRPPGYAVYAVFADIFARID